MNREPGQAFIEWAQREPTVRALILIGSRAKHDRGLGGADSYSDWDFHVVTADVSKFATSAWVDGPGLPKPLAYARRTGRLERAQKISAVFPEGELDLVLIPTIPISFARIMCRLPFGLKVVQGSRRLADLALVIRAGHQVLKGGPAWQRFYANVADNIPASRLTNGAICEIAEGFVCDYVSVLQKLRRGELVAAQRWLHNHLLEVNFRLVHELRSRRGDVSFPDGRRIEHINDCWTRRVTVSACPEVKSLSVALADTAQTFRALMQELVGFSWEWPSFPDRLTTDFSLEDACARRF